MRIKASNANTPNWSDVSVKTSIPEALKPLDEIAHNLWWSWNNEARDLYRELDPVLWKQVNQNPVLLLASMNYERLEELAKDKKVLDKV